MSKPSQGRLLISHITLRGPELRQLYDCIAAHGSILFDDLEQQFVPRNGEGNSDAFGLEEAILREALNFLLITRLVEQHGPSRRKASFRSAPRLAGVPFEPLLLHHLLMQQEPRQRALMLIYRQLVMDNVLVISTPALRNQLERGPLAALFTWTTEKVTFWGHLAGYLGLVRVFQREARQYAIVPQLSLLHATLKWSAQQCIPPYALASVLNIVHEQFFPCFTRHGHVHHGLVQALVALHRQQHIHLEHRSDAAQSVLLDSWRVSEIHVRPMEIGTHT